MGTLQEAVNKIRQAGEANSRIVPTTGSKQVRIEVNIDGKWITVIESIDGNMAEDVFKQAKNRMICG
jgi:hypothetical protein